MALLRTHKVYGKDGEAPLFTQAVACTSATVIAGKGCKGRVYVGSVTVGSDQGPFCELDPGDSVDFAVTDTAQLYGNFSSKDFVIVNVIS